MSERSSLSGLPLDGVPGMRYGPVNELGVVCLFALISKRLGYSIVRVQPGFPDCIALRRTAKGWKQVRIEFEYYASSFKSHGHNPKGCDEIICWENDWPNAPKKIAIRDLRREVEPQRVWIQAVNSTYWDELDARKRQWWSLPKLAKKGDLILFWCRSPRSQLTHVAITEESAKSDARWGWRGRIKIMDRLESPPTLDHLRHNPRLRASSFYRGNFQSRYDVTPYWSDLYKIITQLNPTMRKALAKFFSI